MLFLDVFETLQWTLTSFHGSLPKSHSSLPTPLPFLKDHPVV